MRILAIAATALLLANSAATHQAAAADAPAAGYSIEVTLNGDKVVPFRKLAGSEADVAKYYPLKALKAKKSGEANVRCEDATHCAILNESPGFGFGDAAMYDVGKIANRYLDYPFEVQFLFRAPRTDAAPSP